MKRVIVIGSPGAGKSTFSRKLRDKTGLPLHYLDMMWHLPDRTTISKEEFDNRLTEILKTDRWIFLQPNCHRYISFWNNMVKEKRYTSSIPGMTRRYIWRMSEWTELKKLN